MSSWSGRGRQAASPPWCWRGAERGWRSPTRPGSLATRPVATSLVPGACSSSTTWASTSPGPGAWHGFPGYGWLFPGVGGTANIGLGLGMLSDRGAGAVAAQRFDAFVTHLRRVGVLENDPSPATPLRGRLGGWLKMGVVGTSPGRGRVLLVGDAAGLVNPLQGEGLSQAMGSGRAAAEAVLAGPSDAALRYRRFVGSTYAPYQSITAPAHAALLTRPKAVAAVGRLLTA